MIFSAVRWIYNVVSGADLYVFTFLSCLACALFWFYKTPKNLPPGPWGLPVLGYLPWFIWSKPNLIITELHKKYGPLISFYMGSRVVVVLGNYDVIRSAYVNQGETFSGKPRDSPLEIDGDEEGISVTDGQIWKVQRRFVLKTLRDFGVGKMSLEPDIKEELHYFLSELKKFEGRASFVSDLMGTSIANNICSLEFGKRFEYSDPQFVNLKHTLDQLVIQSDALGVKMYFPWTKKLPGVDWLVNQTTMRKLKKTLYSFLNEILDDHKRQYDSAEHRDIIYAWLDEYKERLQKDEDVEFFAEEKLHFNLMSLFVAGTETLNSTLLWGIMYLAQNPDVQERCQKEIEDVIGNDRLPSTADRPLLPYTEATLLEVQRLGAVIPLNLVHSTTSEATLFGYTIPKHSIVMANIWATHYEPQTWTQPEVFRPERFLDKDGQVTGQERIIPFSIGKRYCLGISLARMELFLYFVGLVQNFTFSPPPRHEYDMDYYSAVIRMPKPFKVCAVFRDTPILKDNTNFN